MVNRASLSSLQAPGTPEELTNPQRTAIIIAKANVLLHLKDSSAAFDDLLTACKLIRGQAVDGLPHVHILRRALYELWCDGLIRFVECQWELVSHKDGQAT